MIVPVLERLKSAQNHIAFIRLIRPEWLINDNGKLVEEIIRGCMTDGALGSIYIYDMIETQSARQSFLIREQEPKVIAMRRETSPRDRLKVLFKEFAKLRTDFSYLVIGQKGYERVEDY